MAYTEITRDAIFRILDEISGISQSRKLDIGSGGKVLNWITIDKSDKGETFSGDIRTLFAPVYNKKIDGDLQKLEGQKFSVIKMQHIIEHIEWIYQKAMFDWVSSLLGSGATLFVETPNVDWIIDQYSKSFWGNKDHPDIKLDDPCALIKWLNFKIYSGCSTNKYREGCTDGDFHLCMYNADLLYHNLINSGFGYISIHKGDTLSCLAKKV